MMPIAAITGTDTGFVRDGPPPLVDSTGDRRWIVDHIVRHEDRVSAETETSVEQSERAANANRTVRFYLVRWLGFHHFDDTWESEQTLLEDVPDIVRDYEQSLPVESRRPTWRPSSRRL